MTVDDIPSLYGVVARARLQRPVSSALDVEAGTEPELERHDDGSIIALALPTLAMHRLVELKHG